MKRDSIDFTQEKVSVLFRKLLIPTLSGALAIAAMTTIDGIFVGHGVGTTGVAAVNIVIPLYQLMMGIGLMIGTGCSVVTAIHLSRAKQKVAGMNITQALVSSSVLASVIIIIALLFPSRLISLLGSSAGLLPQAKSYLLWLLPAFLFAMFSLIGLFIIRLDGSPRFAMWCNLIPALLNILLDWLFIFPLQMGVKGAAIASMLSITVGGLMALYYMLFLCKSLKLVFPKFSLKSMRLSMRNVCYQCKIGASTLFGELTMAVFIYIGNLCFMHYLGDDGVGAFGIACYYAPFFFIIGNSIAQSAQPIISYNHGIKAFSQVKEARNLLLKTAFVFGLGISCLFVFLPESLVGLFVDTQSNSGRIATKGFPYLGTGVVFFIVNVAIIGFYQSMEKTGRAGLLVLLRGFLLLVPSFFMLSKLFGVNGIWLAMPVAELLTTILVFVMWLHTRYRKMKKQTDTI